MFKHIKMSALMLPLLTEAAYYWGENKHLYGLTPPHLPLKTTNYLSNLGSRINATPCGVVLGCCFLLCCSFNFMHSFFTSPPWPQQNCPLRDNKKFFKLNWILPLKTTNYSSNLDLRIKAPYSQHRCQSEEQENLEWERVIGSLTCLLQAGSAFHISMKDSLQQIGCWM